MTIDAFLTLATDAVDLLEQVLVLVHGDPEPHSADPHPDELRSLLYATDALAFAVARYRSVHVVQRTRLHDGDDDLPW